MAKILLVDDEYSVRLTLREFMLDMGHNVDAAESVSEALVLVDKKEYDLIITDILLPKITGIQFLQKLRSQGHNMAAIVMTGEPTQQTHDAAGALGVIDYLIKPVKKADIESVVRRALESV
ncbi:MAG TPA: response regulator [Candidatus Marinimicrobia bacterium]|nr:response regulator [Candidatus Neomarinimicrobiota bacterium]